jgi:GH15 family glucan-1,4-alpha-glucosidase
MESMSEFNPYKQHRYQLGIIGNCNFSALIDSKAEVKWMCWPRFDSSFIFGSLLDESRGGRFSVHPEDGVTSTVQKYLVNTNVLTTRFEVPDGIFEVIDFAPRFAENESFYKPLMLFRKIQRIDGTPRIRICCDPMGEYGQIKAEAQPGSNRVHYNGLEAPVQLDTNAPVSAILEGTPFSLHNDIYLVLSWGVPFEEPLINTFESHLNRTIKYWRTWVEHCNIPRSFQKQVIRSALALKIHQFEDTGGIIASPTTSLPEIPGEGRNWDYRYCWLRDTYYTLNALKALGHFEEMEKYAHFIESLNVHALESIQPVYRIDGSPEMTESELDLQGYQNNSPVRTGNAAYTQIQHDAYGQILLALFSLHTDARLVERGRMSERTLHCLLGYIEKTMEIPDNGVWEFRGRRTLHTYSLLFHWAGAAACKCISQEIGNSELLTRAQACFDRARTLMEKCYDKDKQAYTQGLGLKELDASLLQMITLGYFYDQPQEKAVAHLRAIQKELEITPGFLLRYKHQDDFGVQKSAFMVCSFWYIEALITLGFIEEATELFKKVLGTENHLGLISEDYDTATQSQWGNFPQTYSHVGVIICAFAFDKALDHPPFLGA